jgi:hypothetical protein
MLHWVFEDVDGVESLDGREQGVEALALVAGQASVQLMADASPRFRCTEIREAPNICY